MATWAKGIDFKNSGNTKRIGGIGVYGTDTASEKIYIGLGTEPWSNAGLQLTTTAINFKGNKIYHAGDKPTPADIGAATSSHTHNYAGSSSAGGNANAAVKLATARKLTIGSTGKTFDGSGDIAWTLSEIGAAAASHTHNYAGSSSAGGAANSALACTGNSATATKLQTARTINGVSFDGTANITITAAANGGTSAACSGNSATATKLATARTVFGKSFNGTGNVAGKAFVYGTYTSTASSRYTNGALEIRENGLVGSAQSDIGYAPQLGFHWSGKIAATLAMSSGGEFQFINQAGTGYSNVRAGTFIGALSGNASTATTLQTARTLTIGKTGKSFNGSGNVAWSLSEIGAAASSHTHNYAGSSSAGGAANSANTLATARTINGTSFNGSANITTANWGTARTITIGSTGKSVNGSANVSWSLSEIGAAAASHSHSYLPLSGGTLTAPVNNSYSTSTYLAGNQGKTLINSTCGAGAYTMLYKYPSTNGYFTIGGYQGNFLLQYTAKTTVDAGTNSVTKSVTLLNESGNSSFPGTVSASSFSGALSGNASTASKLQTARTINGTSFNGSANITTANWGTARTITVGSTAKSVNGSANIGWTLAEIGAVPSYTGSSTTIHADSDASSTSEYLLLKAGHNELKIASSAGGTTVTKGQDKLTFNGNIVYHAGRKPTVSEIGAAASSHSHSYLPLSGGTITSNGFTIKTTTATDSSGYITFQDTSGKRRAYITSNSGSSGIKIHTYDSAGTWKSNFVIEEDGSVHIGNGYLKSISEIWGRESSINLNIKKGTGFQGGARFNWTGATNIGAPRFQMIPMDSYDLRVGSPENPIHVVYGRVGYVTTSDREAKTNIHYIDDMQPLGLTNKTSVDEVKTLTKDDFYNFFKDEIRFASYDFKEANLENLETNLGFMAQDIADTKVGSKIVIPPREKIEYYHEDGTITEEKVDNGMYSFSTTNFASATAIALQKAIEKIEILENKIALLNEKLGL